MEGGEEGEKLVHILWKTVQKFLKKLKIKLPYDPSTPLLGIYPKKMKTLLFEKIYHPYFIAALFTIAKLWKQHKCVYIHIYMYICVCVYIYIYIHTHIHIHMKLFSHKNE